LSNKRCTQESEARTYTEQMRRDVTLMRQLWLMSMMTTKWQLLVTSYNNILIR